MSCFCQLGFISSLSVIEFFFLNVKFVRYSVFCLSLQIYNENTDDIKIILLLNVYLTCNDYINMRGGSVYFS